MQQSIPNIRYRAKHQEDGHWIYGYAIFLVSASITMRLDPDYYRCDVCGKDSDTKHSICPYYKAHMTTE